MRSSAELKIEAKNVLRNNKYWTLVLIFFLFGLISWGANVVVSLVLGLLGAGDSALSSILSIAVGIFLLPLSIGQIVCYLNAVRNEEVQVPTLFVGYSSGLMGRSILTMFLSGLYAFLWSLLFIVPGIIKGFAYSLAPYIIIDNPEISGNDAIKLSSEMMEGHKGELFYISMSFIGWIILATIPCGIGNIFLFPYMQTTLTEFYFDVKADYEARNAAKFQA